MAGRPYWSGTIQISLVSFGVKLFVATESKAEIRFHQISRTTGERVKYQKVSASDVSDPSPKETVDKSDIVKGYEFRKGEYVQIEPDEIANIRIPSKDSIELQQFVDLKELDPAFFEKPYFVVPENDSQSEAFAVVREALLSMNKAGLGKIAFGGREHLVAIAPPTDKSLPGMMAYTMRYAEELRNASEYFADIKTPKVQSDQLDLAKQLIKRKAATFNPTKWTDEYEAALRELVEAKVNARPLPKETRKPHAGKVVNLMDALRASIRDNGEREAPPRKKAPGRVSVAEAERGLTLVKGSPAAKSKSRKRQSA